MFLFGIALVLLGTLFGLPAMRERLQLNTLVRQGDLQSVLLFGVLVSTALIGPLMDRFGHKLVLALSAVLVAVALGGFAFADSYRAAQGLSFVLGVGGGGLNMATNVLVSDIYDENRGARLNQLGVFFGVGALLMPFVTAWVVRAITQLILISAVLSALCAIGYLVLQFPSGRERSAASILDSFKAIRYPGVLFFGFLLFFESGNESAMTGWVSTWATNLGATARSATLVLALLQGMMMIGRLLAAPVLRHVKKTNLVLGSAVAAFLSVAVLLAANSPLLLAIGAGLTGLAFASIYPTVLALAGDRYQRHSATVFGILFTVGLSGAMFYPWAIGHASQSQGLRAGMIFPLVGTAAITVLMAIIRAKFPQTSEQDR